ncbi:MAG TPA: hypothetical protein VI316_03755 [Candidatus Dormibacteraeota bacterium]
MGVQPRRSSLPSTRWLGRLAYRTSSGHGGRLGADRALLTVMARREEPGKPSALPDAGVRLVVVAEVKRRRRIRRLQAPYVLELNRLTEHVWVHGLNLPALPGLDR